MSDREWDEWAHHVREDLIPKMTDSAFVMTLVPGGDSDIKFAVELGLSIMMDKPILAIVPTGRKLPRKLRMVADRVISGGPGDEGFQDRLMAAIKDITKLIEREGR